MRSAMPAVSSEGNISRYLQEIHKFPLLSQEEESALARLWRDNQDIAAAHRLVTSHLRLVAKIAAGYRGYGLPLGDLINEGSVGMLRAIERFDPERGFRLASYASSWIRGAMQDFVLRSWSLVKVGTTTSQKKLFFNLHRLKSQMQISCSGDLRPEEVNQIAEALDVLKRDVVCMNRRLGGPDQSLNEPVRAEHDIELQDHLVNETENHDSVIAEYEELSGRKALLPIALNALGERELHILVERQLKENPATLRALAAHYGISAERVRQIEVRAFEKLQKAMKAQVEVLTATVGFESIVGEHGPITSTRCCARSSAKDARS